MTKEDKLRNFKKCFDGGLDNHLKKNKDLFKKDIRAITNKCLSKVKLKAR